MQNDIRNITINPITFYKIGIFCFSTTAICTFANFFVYWGIWNIFSKILNIATLIFNLALVGLFNYLLKTNMIQTQNTINEISTEDIRKAFEEANDKPKKAK